MDIQSLEKIRYLMEVGRYQMAIDEIRTQLSAHPDTEIYYYYLANCHFHLDQYREATEAIKVAIQMEPDDADNHVTLSQIMVMRNRYADGEAAGEEAVALDPENANAHIALAQARHHLNKYKLALESIEAALAIEPNNDVALAICAQIQRGLGRHDDAAATTKALLAEAPNDALAMFTQAENSLIAGDFEDALAHYREALRIDPTFKAAREGAAQAVMTRYALFNLAMRLLIWLYRLKPAIRYALIGACIFVFVYTPPEPRLAIAWIVLRMVLLAASIFAMLASPLMTAAMMATREGRDVLPGETKRAAMWTVASLGVCGSLTLVWAVFGIAGYFAATTYGFAALLTSISIEDAHPSWPRRTLITMTAASIGAAMSIAVLANSFDLTMIDALADKTMKASDVPTVTRLQLIVFTLLYSGRLFWLIGAMLAGLFLDEIVVKE